MLLVIQPTQPLSTVTFCPHLTMSLAFSIRYKIFYKVSLVIHIIVKKCQLRKLNILFEFASKWSKGDYSCTPHLRFRDKKKGEESIDI